jgi:hydrogenase maturation factor
MKYIDECRDAAAVQKFAKAIEIASAANIISCFSGDMLRVPGSDRDMLSGEQLPRMC